MPIPDDVKNRVKREHVLKALEIIDRDGVPPENTTRNTFLVMDNKKYPVKYVVHKAAQVAGLELPITDFTTVDARNYLRRLGFKIIKEKWYLGVKIVDQVSRLFLEYAADEGLPVSPAQLGHFSKSGTTIYLQLKLPSKLRVNSKWVHFEWLARPEESGARFWVGLHLEFPRERKELNRKLADLILRDVDLGELGRRVSASVNREDKRIFTWIMAGRMEENPQENKDEIVKWLARSMVEFYRAFLPPLETYLSGILPETEHKYWIEISGPPRVGYVGKILITPNEYRKIKPGDVVYHYITDKGPKDYKKTFIGKSRVKEGFRKIPKEEALARLKEYVNWDEKFEKFAQEKWGKAKELYVAELENFQEFNPPISLKKVSGVFTPAPKYLVKASSDIVRILESLDGGDNMIGKIEEKIDWILLRKGQLILYGPPGTGKTWLASKYIRHKVPNGVHSFGKDSSLRDDLKYYLLVMSTAKYDPSRIKEGLEEVFSGKLRHAFEEVEEGDIAFVYLTHPYKRITAIARCTGKTKKGTKFKIIQLVNGPTYEEMKREEPMSDSPAVRTMLRGTLFPLSHEEAQWVASKIGFDALKPLGVLDEGTKREFKAVEFVTFHPAFSYEDFVEGIKPETYEDPETGRKELLFKVEEGVFRRISRNAYNALLAWAGVQKEWTENTGLPSLSEDEMELVKGKIKSEPDDMPRFYLIIDEINRGDIPKIFGELITLLETDKRLFMDNETVTTLPYSKKRFGVPPNLHIIGTMNTSDRSIALMDVALRRRFGFIEMMPDYEVLKEHIIDNSSEEVKPLAGIAVSALKVLNKRIKREYDRDHQIGHSYYFRLKEHLNSREEFLRELKMIWFHEILPLLQEYFYDSPEKLERVLKSKSPTNSFLRDSEDGVELKSEDEFTDEAFLEALKALIGAERE